MWLLLALPPAGDLASNPDMCSDWEMNRQPFGSQASAQSTEPHQPGRHDCSEPQFADLCNGDDAIPESQVVFSAL